jgi:hypothetical protein
VEAVESVKVVDVTNDNNDAPDSSPLELTVVVVVIVEEGPTLTENEVVVIDVVLEAEDELADTLELRLEVDVVKFAPAT